MAGRKAGLVLTVLAGAVFVGSCIPTSKVTLKPQAISNPRGPGDSSPPASPLPDGTSIPEDAPHGLSQRIPVSGLSFPTSNVTGTLQLVRAFPNLSFENPAFLGSPSDGTNRIFVADLSGRIYVFPNNNSVTSATVFIDLRPVVVQGGEEGLIGMAFDPGYRDNGYFYVHHSMANPRRSVVARYRASSTNPNAGDASSRTVLLEIPQPYSNHNGGSMAFGPDGMLYIGSGDGGGSNDPGEYAQNRSSLLGKILRIDPHGNTPYSIPSDNPFVNESDVRGEIWAYGLRNPWRFSFDRLTGDFWVGDVGQNATEEINLVTRGGNYGWKVFEGHRQRSGYTDPGNHIPPVHTYGHDSTGGYSVTGGYVYRGSAAPSLYGSYVYGDYVSGRIWAFTYANGQANSNRQIATLSNISSFGEDELGELYAISLSSRTLHRFVETNSSGSSNFPTQLSATGLFSDTANLVASPGVIPYDVNIPLWSDGADKRRWIALPGTSRIAFSEGGSWSFPPGAVLVKHFEIETAPGILRRLETRVLVNEQSGWAGYTYRWNDAQTDATLLTSGQLETLTVNGRTLTWQYPDRADCLSCHTVAAGRVLGVNTHQLNGNFDYGGVTDNQLRAWNHIGLFTTDIGAASSRPAYPRFLDRAASLRERARGYLAVNCAHCHRPDGPATGEMDMRYATPSTQMNLIGVTPTEGTLGLANSRRISPGSRTSSVLWERLRRLDDTRMPPLGSHAVDQDALEAVGAWIDSGAH